MMPKFDEYQFWVYILSNRSHVLYIGFTNSLRRRIFEHRQLKPGTFTARYKNSPGVLRKVSIRQQRDRQGKGTEALDKSPEDRFDRGSQSDLGGIDAG